MNNPDFKYFISEKNEAMDSLSKGNYAEAVSHLRAAAKIDVATDRDAEALEARFFYMLRFLAADNTMPDMDRELADIEAKFRELARRIELEDIRLHGTSIYSGMLRYAAMRPEETLESLFSDYIAELDRLNTDTAVLTDTRRRSGLERIAGDIFNRIWTAFPLSNDQSRLVESMLADESIPQYDRELWTSALGLNYGTYPTDSIADVLLGVNAYDNERLSTLAAVWLVLGIRGNDATGQRVTEAITSRHPTDLPDILLEWCRSLAHTALSRSGKGDGMERLGKLGRNFMNRMQDVDPGKYEEKLTDPEWLNSQFDSKDYEAIKNFAEAQSKGEDVFMGTLGKMRHFDFFNTLSNWFLPFHTAHSSLAPVVDGEGAALADTVSAIPVLCDSDKYAMLLSMTQIPSGMAAGSMATLSQQMMSLTNTDEFAEMRKAVENQPRRALINNEIKNIYRFFMLHKSRNEFADTLSRAPGRDTIALIAEGNTDAAGEIADMLFAADCHADAAGIYGIIRDKLSAVQLHRYAKAAAIAGRTELAESIYRDLLSDNSSDTRAALSLTRILASEKRYTELIDAARTAADASPDNVALLRTLAEALASIGQWEEATEVYHNINYIQPDEDNEAKTDLAWALTVTGDYDSADALFGIAHDDAATLAKKAVLQWLSGRHADAIDTAADADVKDVDGNYRCGILYRKGLEAIAGSDSPHAKSLHMLYEIVRYRRYGSPFGNI